MSRITRRGRLAITTGVVVLGAAGALVAGGIIDPWGASTGGDHGKAVPVVAQPYPTASPVLPGFSDGGPLPTESGLAAALTSALADPGLGTQVGVSIVDAETGESLYSRSATTGLVPASTLKIATAVAALEALGPDHRLTTKAVLQPGEPATVVLVGGGDPTLAGPRATGTASPGYPQPAKLIDLVDATVKALADGGVTTVRLGYDTSLYSGPDTGPAWKPSYIGGGNVAPVTALQVDAGRPNPASSIPTLTPAADAAQQFAGLLAERGIRVEGKPAAMTADSAARELAAVQSPPVSDLVDRLLTRSDNDLAEALARAVALAKGEPASFVGGATAVRDVLVGLGVDAPGLGLIDGSGLSPDNRLSPAALTQLLVLAASEKHPKLRAAAAGMPIAGFTGTLAKRFLKPDAAAGVGLVRAKTGTLLGASTLAGYVADADGRLLAFAVLANGVTANGTPKAEAALDRIAAVLAGCGCRSGH
jgi:D-alanyl-D-alanine carboxypeptidase/D-alanyl-D-alanine-endopeptidase (penicillin-binding protein 4)